MPQKKLMMIHSTFATPPISFRLTMSITHRTKATGCRKIASRISTISLINSVLVFHERVEQARDPRPPASRRIRPIGRLLVGRLDLAAGHLAYRFEKPVDLGLGVVRGKARADRAR